MPLDARISDVPGLENAAYVTLGGSFDLRSADNFDRFARKMLHEERKRFFILDVEGISDCVPVAIQVLRDFSDSAAGEGGAVAVVNPSEPMMDSIAELDLAEAFTFFNDYKAAFEHLRHVKAQNRTTGTSKEIPMPQLGAPGPGAPAGEQTRYYAGLGPPQGGAPVSLNRSTGLNLPPPPPPGAGGLQFEMDADESGTVRTRRVTPGGTPMPGINATPPGGPSGGHTGGWRLRAYDHSGTLHTSESGPPTTITRVMVLTPPENEHVLRVFCDAVENAGFEPEALYPLREDQGWEHVVQMIAGASMVLCDFAPCRARVPDPNSSVLTAATLARAMHGSQRLFIMTSDRRPPPLWRDVAYEVYNDSRAQLRQMIPVLVDRLKRQARLIAGGAS
ncbi:MAG: STAS domain-containing protein [Planctomycetota bacterium]